MTDIDSYLAPYSDDIRTCLNTLRAAIHATLAQHGCQAQESISYAMPAFRLPATGRKKGAVVAGFAVHKSHLSYYPHSGTILPQIDLSAHNHTLSALHFTPADPIPAPLLDRLIRLRLAELACQSRPAPP